MPTVRGERDYYHIGRAFTLEFTLDVHVGDLTIPTRFVVSDNVTEPMLDVNWLKRNQIIWDFAQDVLIVNGEVFSLLPEDEQRACRRARALEDAEAKLLSNERGYKIDLGFRGGGRKRKSRYKMKRPRLESPLPATTLNRVRAFSLLELMLEEEDQAHGVKEEEQAHWIRDEEEGYVNTVYSDDSYRTIIDDIFFDVSVSKPTMRTAVVNFTYSCYVCRMRDDPHTFTRAGDLVKHNVGKHAQYPDDAMHNQ